MEYNHLVLSYTLDALYCVLTRYHLPAAGHCCRTFFLLFLGSEGDKRRPKIGSQGSPGSREYG